MGPDPNIRFGIIAALGPSVRLGSVVPTEGLKPDMSLSFCQVATQGRVLLGLSSGPAAPLMWMLLSPANQRKAWLGLSSGLVVPSLTRPLLSPCTPRPIGVGAHKDNSSGGGQAREGATEAEPKSTPPSCGCCCLQVLLVPLESKCIELVVIMVVKEAG